MAMLKLGQVMTLPISTTTLTTLLMLITAMKTITILSQITTQTLLSSTAMI